MSGQLPIQRNPSSFDIAVIGGGLAGITAAFRAADEGARVLLCCTGRLCSGSSFYPRMDTIHCQCTADQADEAVFAEDIRACSARMNDTYMNRFYIRNIRDCITYLASLGLPVQKLPEKKLPCFGSHAHDLYYWKDWDAIRTVLYQKLSATPAITLLEHTELIGLIRESQGFLSTDNQWRINGICVYHRENAIYSYFHTKAVILATGGFGALYRHNLNSSDVSGCGHALALKAGASLINLEFNQFIPGFISPGYKIVFREGSLDYCTGLYDCSGTNVLLRSFPSEKEMKSCLARRSAHGPFTTTDHTALFDLALFHAALEDPAQGVQIRYSQTILDDSRSYVQNYVRWLWTQFHINIAKDPVFIAPFFHAANGGIFVDHSCQSTVPGLFACGECAGGIHGADRLGGNASGSCLVFGMLAAQSAARYARQCSCPPADTCEIQAQLREIYRGGPSSSSPEGTRKIPAGTFTPEQILHRIRDLMWRYGNVERTKTGLDAALADIRTLREDYRPWDLLLDTQTKAPGTVFLAEHFLTLSEALILSMSARKESRGGHYRSDYPSRTPDFDMRFTVSLKNGMFCVRETPCMDF